ncbi:MAG TPA: hypothetical protein PLW31_03140 [Bacteroidales bacterium]|nr:hypothetical protein [Bacteroidales bacterium]
MTHIKTIKDLEVKTDRYGRWYPYRILLANGEIMTGLYSGSSTVSGVFDLIWFKVVEDLNEWINNRDHIGTRMVYLKPEEIKEMTVIDEFTELLNIR